MATVTGRVTRYETPKAQRVLATFTLPEGVRGFSVEPGSDHDGDPVMVVWLNVEDANRPDRARAKLISAFENQVGTELHKVLQEYRPQFRIRAA